MSKYSTGEIAKLCSVTVRTVQYYDTRGILIPSELSEGGRRLYSEDDLKRMKIICFLRELDLPIGAIAQILKEEHPEKVISLLIEQQEKALSDEITDKEEKLLKLRELKNGLKEKNLLSETADSERKYFVSDNAEAFENHALIFMGDSLGGAVEQVDIEE